MRKNETGPQLADIQLRFVRHLSTGVAVQLFLLLTTYNLLYTLFVGQKCFLIEKYGIFQSRAVYLTA